MTKLKNGTFKGVFALPINNSFEFRYVIDGSSYINDSEADSFRWNDYANTENGVLEV